MDAGIKYGATFAAGIAVAIAGYSIISRDGPSVAASTLKPAAADSQAGGVTVDAAAEAAAKADAAAADATRVAAEGSERADDAAPAGRHFTREEFDRYVNNKTKEQIRTEFGTPMSVHDDSDTWVYSNLPVYDAQAGTREMVSIRFAGTEGA